MKELTEEQKKILSAIQPAIEKLARAINVFPSLCFTGFIYSDEPPIFMHMGNIANQGAELVQIHYNLAMMAAMVEASGDYAAARVDSLPEGSTSEEIADKLALSLMAVPLGEHSESIKELLHQYIKSRRPERA